MLKSHSLRRRAVAFATLLGVSCSPSLWAQERPNPATASLVPPELSTPPVRKQFEELAPGTTTQISIPIRNIKASLMAYWLDPANQPTPIHLQMSAAIAGENPYLPQNQEEPRLPGNAKGPVGLKLPEGVTRIVPVDPQNRILAIGTKEGLQALDKLIPTIDVPLVQYEVEAQFIQVSLADLPQLGLNFGKPVVPTPFSGGSVAKVGNFRAPLDQLIAQGRAKTLTAPRVTIIDGLTAQLEQKTTTPVVLDEEAWKKAVLVKPEEATTPQNANPELLQAMAYVSTTIGMRATARQLKNDLIALSITPTLGTRTMSVDATVRDGHSLAIQWSAPKDEQQTVVIVTTRQIRRVGDDN